MILTRFVRVQLVIFAVVTVLVVTYGSLRYVELPRLLGFGTYPVSVIFSDGARLYPSALVTYRGVEVGKVDRLAVSQDGVEVVLQISNDVRVPSDVHAEAHSVSAVGEQYVELLPQRDGGPYLQPGDAIPRSRTTVPVEIGPVLEQVNALASSIPSDDLNTVIDELHVSFAGRGGDLQRMIDSSRLLLGSAQTNLQPTQRLITDLEPALRTQAELSEPLHRLTSDLASFSDELRTSDPRLRQLLDQGPEFAQEINGLFQDMQPTLPLLLANMVSTGEVVVTYLAGVQQLLVVYPAVIDSFYAALSPNPQRELVKINFNLNVNDPPVCTKGFIPVSERRSPADLSLAPVPRNIYCKEPPKDPRDVRGARNLPCPNDPRRRAGTPQDCGLTFHRASPYPGRVSDEGPVSFAQYHQGSGRFQGPDGLFYVLGDEGKSSPNDEGWQSLLLNPLNLGK